MTRWLEPGAAVGLVGGYVAILALTAPDIGFVRDEGYYFKAASEYVGWFSELARDPAGAVERGTIDRYFSYNHEHPALVKLVQGGLHQLLHEELELTSSSQGFRWAGFLYAGLALLGTYVLGRQIGGPGAGLISALFLSAMPRFFFDAHLACFDVPMTAMWAWSLAAFSWMWAGPPHRAPTRAVGVGVVFGLALATKLNALFLPLVFGLGWIVCPPGRWWPRRVRLPDGRREVQWLAIPWSLLIVALVGSVVSFATWPWLWPAPVERLAEYFRFHLQHEHYPILYFGELHVKPPFPWSFPWVMTLFTVPASVLWLGGLGLAAHVPALARRRPEAVVLVVGTLLPILLISVPTTPIFGGTKHWYNALPTLSVAAAWVVVRAGRDLAARVSVARGRWVPAVAALGIALPGWAGAARFHPNGIAYYNELAGGVRGAAELGMQRSFWGYVPFPLYRRLDDWVDRGRVFFNRTNYDSYRQYRRDALIPPGITYANDPQHADVGIQFEQPEHGESEGGIWANLGTRPVAGVYEDEVTLGQIYVEGLSERPPDLGSRCVAPPSPWSGPGPGGVSASPAPRP